jgi:uncharacterized protein (TIGR02265 family)
MSPDICNYLSRWYRECARPCARTLGRRRTLSLLLLDARMLLVRSLHGVFAMHDTTRFATARSTTDRNFEDVSLPSVPRGFVRPDDAAPFDPLPNILAVPSDHGIRGLYFNSMIDEANIKGVAISADRSYIDFKYYPVREQLELMIDVAQRFHPGSSLRGAVRRIGRTVYPVFAASLVGRVMFGVLGNDLARIMKIASKGYECSLSHAHASVVACNPHSARVRLENNYAFIDAYQVGVFEGALEACNREGEVYVRQDSVSEGEIFVRWR